MDHIKELLMQIINTFLHNPNQFASGGLLLMAVGSVIASLRQVPGKIWEWITEQTTVTMTITDDQRMFWWLKAWLESQNIMKRTRRIDVMNRGANTYAIIPAPGHHWMFYKFRLISIQLTRTEEKKLGMTQRAEAITMTTVGRKQDLFRRMIKEIYDAYTKQEEKLPELHAWGSYAEWQRVHGYQPRPLDSVILPAEDKNRIIKDIESFRENREWYTNMGIPYRKGYLLYGPPGTGKTSLVTGLSSHFKSNVYVLKLSDMSDSTLREAVSGVESNSFLVMEDVDTVSAAAVREDTEDMKKTGVSLSGLLNVIDGMFTPSGAVFVMTTNHKDKLDPALIRPGRVDLQLHITYANLSQKQELYNRFFNGPCPEKYLNQQMTMAELQQSLMEQKFTEVK